MIRGHRMSLLEITQYCALAGSLSQQYGTGRAALVSRAYHARLAGAPDAQRLFSGLTSDEADDVVEWKVPVDVILEDVVLRYEDAEKEVAVALDALGDYVDPTDTCEAITVGHLDFAWIVERKGQKWAYVADLKRSIWTPSYDPESLQLHAYGRAYAKKNECAGYITGCWAAIEGVWRWAREAYSFDEIGTDLIWDKIYFAATNKGNTGTRGDYCDSCFSRLHCPEYLLPAALLETPLAALCKRTGDGIVPTDDEASVCYDHIKAGKALFEAAEEQLKSMVKAGAVHVYLDEDHRYQWAPVEQKGREKLDEAKLKEALGDLTPYKTRGAPFSRFQRVKVGG